MKARGEERGERERARGRERERERERGGSRRWKDHGIGGVG